MFDGSGDPGACSKVRCKLAKGGVSRGRAHLETVRALPDGGGDVHEAHVIGWATSVIGTGGDTTPGDMRREVISLLLERGVRHHISSVIATAGPDLIRQLVEEGPDALDRRQSRFDQRRCISRSVESSMTSWSS
jgi:hypothetical protein